MIVDLERDSGVFVADLKFDEIVVDCLYIQFLIEDFDLSILLICFQYSKLCEE